MQKLQLISFANGKELVKQVVDTIRYFAVKGMSRIEFDGVLSILFVCYGNICRSAFAEHYARTAFQKKGLNVIVFSGGLLAKQGESSPENAIIAADMFNVDLRRHAPTPLNGEIIKHASLVFGMHYYNFQALQREFPHYSDKYFLIKHLLWPRDPLLNINDPFGKPLEEFIRCFRNIKICIDTLIERFEIG